MKIVVIIVGVLLLALLPFLGTKDVPAQPPSQDPAKPESIETLRDQAWEKVAELVDKLFLDGKVAKVTKTISDPATYKHYADLAYSMNPVDLFYYSTSDYKKELLYNGVMTITKKVASIAGPVVGFEVTMGLEALDHIVQLKRDQKPFEYTPDIRTKFFDAFKTLIRAEGKWGKAFDFAFVDRTGNDAIREIKALSASFRDSASKLEQTARDIRAEEENKKAALEKEADERRKEIARLGGELTGDPTPERKAELGAQIQSQERALASLQNQIQLCDARLLLAEQVAVKAEQQRDTAVSLDRIADGVKGNLPLLGKLADYVQKNKSELGLPASEVDSMVEIYREVAKRKYDWKGKLEDLYEIYQTKGFSELLNLATEETMALGGTAVAGLEKGIQMLRNLQSSLDPIMQKFDLLNSLVEAAEKINDSFFSVIFYGENHWDKVRKVSPLLVQSEPFSREPLASAAPRRTTLAGGSPLNGLLLLVNEEQAAGDEFTADDLRTIRDNAKKAIDILERKEKLDKKLEFLKPVIDKLKKINWLPILAKEFGLGKKDIEELQGVVDQLEKDKQELVKYLEEHSEVLKAKKWLEEKMKDFDELKKKWKGVIETMTDLVGLLDKDMPTMDLAPDQDFKDAMLGWFGGKGTTYTGFITVGDDTSGINPDAVHLFYFDKQDQTNHEIKNIKVIPNPAKTEEYAVKPTRIHEARVRYRFDPPGPGDYVIWGYVRDRAGHASCALANSRCSQEEDHAKWKFEPEKEEDRKILEFVKNMMKEVGCDPDEVFRKRDFHQVVLKLKVDETPATVLITEPYNSSDQGLDPNRPLRFSFEVEDQESWFRAEDVSAWITDEFGRIVWDSYVPESTFGESRQGDEGRARWQITPKLNSDQKERYDKTKFMPKAVFEIPGAKHEGPGLYYACVQVVNGAQLLGGSRTMFFVGDVKPWAIISDIRPFQAVYKQGDVIKMTHTFWNIKDNPIQSVKLNLKSAPSVLTVVSAEPGSNDVKPIPTGGRAKLTGEHVFKVGQKPAQSQTAMLVYECELQYGPEQPDRKVMIEVPVNLFDEDALRIYYVKGALHFKYQDQTRPVPQGTMLSISQVYQMRALGTPKWVEQYVGYGEVGNDAGEFFIKISPIGNPPYRMRLVAKSQAREKNLAKGGYVGTAGVFGAETSRPLTCITFPFDVSVSKENVIRNNVYDLGMQIIPYYSSFLRAKSQRIPIQWEGELSTGGYISPYGHDFASNPYLAYGDFLQSINTTDISRAVTGQAPEGVTDIGKSDLVTGQKTGIEGVRPGVNAMETGIWYLNFNGSLSILESLVKGYRFSKGLSYLARDASPYGSATLPLAIPAGEGVVKGLPGQEPPPKNGKPDSAKNATKIDIPGILNKARGNFPYRAELIQENHVKEDFFESYDFVYQSDDPPPVSQYLQLHKKKKVVNYQTRSVDYRVFVVADTKNNRVVQLEPSSNVVTTVLGDLKAPASAEQLDSQAYLVCERGGNRVGIFISNEPLWSCPRAEKPNPLTLLSGPEYATATDAGTIIICDVGKHRVFEIDPRNDQILWSFDKLKYPVMAQSTPKGTVLITDRDADRVLEIDTTGKVLWSFDSLKKPRSAMSTAGVTIIADSGNRRVVHVNAQGQVVRSIGPIHEVKTNPTTGKLETNDIALDQLAFAARFSGVDYLINGDLIYSVTPPPGPGEIGVADTVTGRWGEKDLSGPERFTIASAKATVKKEIVTYEDDPFYVWKDTVKIIKKPKTTIYVDKPGGGIKLDPKYREDAPWAGATANYTPGGPLARAHGLYTSGVSTNMDRLRIYVNGGNQNADDNDPMVLARAYGSLMRNKLIRKSLTAHDYTIKRRCRPQDAWERCWDTFIACAITEKGKFVDLDFLGKEITANTFDLDATFQEMQARYKDKPETLQNDFGDYRGIDSPFAQAMLLRQLHRQNGMVVINHAITFARGGTTADGLNIPQGRYIDPATLLALYPQQKETFEVLGLIPKLTLKFPDQGVQTLDTAYPKLEWDANGIVDDPDSLSFNLIIAEDNRDNVVQTIPGIQGQAFDFGLILKPEEAALKLAEKFEGKKTYYWRVEVLIEDGPFVYRCSTPWGAFTIEVKTQVIEEKGGAVRLEASASPLRQYGKLTVPPGALDREMRVSFHPIGLPRGLGDFEAVHPRAFEVRTGNATFKKPATLEFFFIDKDLAGRDPKGLGIYRFDAKQNRWEYVGGIVKPRRAEPREGPDERSISVDPSTIDGIYALLYDKRGPEFSDVTDFPDPARRSDTLTIRFGLRKPTVTTLQVTDASDKVLRTLCDKQLLAGVNNSFQMALADLPEGRYYYTLSGADPVGRKAETVKRTFLLSEATRGAVAGLVKTVVSDQRPVASKERPVTGHWPLTTDHYLKVYIDDTSLEYRSPDGAGNFLLSGVAPGKYEVIFERPGTFPEKVMADVKSGETTDLGTITLSDRVLQGKLASDVFTPNTGGDKNYAVLEIECLRACLVQVKVLNEKGRPVADLGRRNLTQGRNVILWQGLDDRSRLLPSGWYTLEVTADALGVWVPAAKLPVLLDRGLVNNCVPLPRIFSPNGDGFEDDVQITYLLDAPALVTLEIRDVAGRILAVPARDVKQQPGPNFITWDGKASDGKVVPDGRYFYLVSPKYVTGQQSIKVTGDVLVDCAPPELVDLTPANGSAIADGRPVITAKVKTDPGNIPPDGLGFKIDGLSVKPDTYDPKTGVFAFQPRTSLGEGLHIAIAFARNLAGNEALPRAVSFTIDRSGRAEHRKVPEYRDKEPPTIDLKTPVPGSTVYTPTPLVSALLFDDGSGIDDKNILVYLDGERICNNVKMFLPGTSGKSWDWYYYEKAIILYDPLLGEMRFIPGAALAPGKHHVRIEVLDRQGNPAKPAESIFNVVIDNDPPKITDFSPAPDSKLVRPVERITAKIVDEGPSGLDLSTLRLLVNGKEVSEDFAKYYDPKTSRFDYPLKSPLAAGSQHVIVLTVRDRAGNQAQAKTSIVTVLQDTDPPRIDVYAPRPGQEFPSGPIHITAAVYDVGVSGIDESTLRINLDDRQLVTGGKASVEGLSFNYQAGIMEMVLPAQTSGPHVMALFVRDRAGNGAQEVIVPFNVRK